MTWRDIKIMCMVCFCLLLSVQAFARVIPHGSVADVKQVASGTVQPPCNDCPCDDDHGGRECGPACSCCSESASLPGFVISVVTTIVEIASVPEPLFIIPQVYFPVFVPPQNRSLAEFRQHV